MAYKRKAAGDSYVPNYKRYSPMRMKNVGSYKRKPLPSYMSRGRYLHQSILSAVGSKEMKFNDYEITTPSALGLYSAATVASAINGIASGTDYNQRIGRIINLQSLEFSYDVRCDFAANAYTATKVVIVYDKQTNGAAPFYSDMYFTTALHSRKNVNNEDRFVILHEEIICQGIGETASVPGAMQNSIVRRKGYIKLRGLKTMYTGVGGTVGSIDSGGLFVVAVNDNGSHSFIAGAFRVRFYD